MPLEIARTADDVREALIVNLRTTAADDIPRERERLVLGPQPYRHSHYSSESFYEFDAASGAVHSPYGQRQLRVTPSFVRSLYGVLEQELGEGPPADELMYQFGHAWGAADMAAFVPRLEQEYEIQFDRFGMSAMLETWWWPFRAAGWGTWRFNFEHARQGLILIDLQDSFTVHALAPAPRFCCSMYAGLYSAVFSRLAQRELSGVELTCKGRGDADCRFLIATLKRTAAATFWRDEGMPFAEMLPQLTSLSPT